MLNPIRNKQILIAQKDHHIHKENKNKTKIMNKIFVDLGYWSVCPSISRLGYGVKGVDREYRYINQLEIPFYNKERKSGTIIKQFVSIAKKSPKLDQFYFY